MILVCHVIFRDHVTKVSCDIMVGNPSCKSPSKFGGHRHFGGEEQDSICSHLNPLFLFISKGYGL